MLRARDREGPRSERAAWWRVFAFAALAIGGWAFAVPLLTGPDEGSQVVRAAGVVRGDVVGDKLPVGGNTWVEVRAPAGYEDVDEAGACFLGDPYEAIFGSHQPRARVDSCARVVASDDEASLPTYQYRGQPFAYALVGVPSLWLTGENGLYLMRAITTLLGAAFVASAWLSVRHLPDPRTAAVALAAALTPSTLYFSGVVNPIGLEMAAALSAWTAGLALAVSPAPPAGRLVTRAGLGVAVLVSTRGLGPVFAAVVVGVCALLADPDRRRALARRADVRWWGVGLAACVAATAAWLVLLQREYPLPERAGNGVAQAFGQLPWFGQGLVAVFGSTDVVPPAALHVAWAAVVAVVLVVGARHGRGRDLLLALALLVAGAAMLVSGEGLSIPQTGYWWQGRYVFPLFAGAVLVAGATVGRQRPGDDAARSGATALAAPVRAGLLVVVALCQVWAFGYALRHYTVGFDGSLNPVDVLFDGYWTPVVGTAWLWTICLVAGVVGLAVTAWSTRPAAGPDGDDALAAGAGPLATGADSLEPATGRAGAPTVALGAAR